MTKLFLPKSLRSHFVTGSIKNLIPAYGTLHNILMYTLNPKDDDSHNLSITMIDVLVLAEREKGGCSGLHVS